MAKSKTKASEEKKQEVLVLDHQYRLDVLERFTSLAKLYEQIGKELEQISILLDPFFKGEVEMCKLNGVELPKKTPTTLQ